MSNVKMVKCCICGTLVEESDSNNAWPVRGDGRCCFECNMDVVVPARLKMLSPRSYLHMQGKKEQ